MRQVRPSEAVARLGERVHHELRPELERSRRYEHSLALLWMPISDAGRVQQRAADVRACVREVDRVVATASGVFVLLPECTALMGEALVARLANEHPGLVPFEVRVVAFPEDGLTEASLLEQLVSGARQLRLGERAPALARAQADPDGRAVRSFARRVLVRVRGLSAPDEERAHDHTTSRPAS